jgi:SNF2 family DNA or RNA helicase
MTERLKPFPFQADTIRKLAGQRSRLCGHDMGLGKTLIGVELDRINRAQAERDGDRRRLKTLIVTPLSVIQDGAWQRALASNHPGVPVYVINPKLRTAFEKDASDGRKPGIFICHWESLRLMKGLSNVDWFHIIADEVHRAKSRKAQQTRALKALHTDFKTGLSGTPADNLPQDLWSILNWLWPQYYRSYWRFVDHYCIMEQTPQGYRKFVGPKNTASLLEEMEPWYDRKLKVDVLKDLPEKYYTDVWVELTPGQRRSYDQMRKEMIAWVGKQDQEKPLVASIVAAQLTRLQQFAIGSAEVTGWVTKKTAAGDEYQAPVVKMTEPSSKLDALMEIIEDSGDMPIVVFSQFKGSIRMLEERCTKAKIPIGTLTGDTKPKDRERAIQDFQAGKLKVFAGTIAAGGVGITLTVASTVVFLDRAWSPSWNNQAEDRLHRIGQKNAVQVIDIMARNTVDLGRRTKIQQKWEWLREVLGDK